MAFPIVNISTLGGALSKLNRKKCFKCKGKGYLGELRWLGNKVCDKCKGTGMV